MTIEVGVGDSDNNSYNPWNLEDDARMCDPALDDDPVIQLFRQFDQEIRDVEFSPEVKARIWERIQTQINEQEEATVEPVEDPVNTAFEEGVRRAISKVFADMPISDEDRAWDERAQRAANHSRSTALKPQQKEPISRETLDSRPKPQRLPSRKSLGYKKR